jgi:hypothetical protein
MTHQTLYLSILPSLLRLVLKTSLLQSTFWLLGTSYRFRRVYVFFCQSALYSAVMAVFYNGQSDRAFASSRVVGL